MEEQLHNNDVLMYSNIMIASNCWYVYKIIKNKIYKRMTANENKCYLPYLNKLVEE